MVNEMHEGKNSIPEHVEVDTYEESDFEENPFSKGLNVMVSVPSNATPVVAPAAVVNAVIRELCSAGMVSISVKTMSTVIVLVGYFFIM